MTSSLGTEETHHRGRATVAGGWTAPPCSILNRNFEPRGGSEGTGRPGAWQGQVTNPFCHLCLVAVVILLYISLLSLNLILLSEFCWTHTQRKPCSTLQSHMGLCGVWTGESFAVTKSVCKPRVGWRVQYPMSTKWSEGNLMGLDAVHGYTDCLATPDSVQGGWNSESSAGKGVRRCGETILSIWKYNLTVLQQCIGRARSQEIWHHYLVISSSWSLGWLP